MCLDETSQRFQMAFNTDLLPISVGHTIKCKIQGQCNFCAVDGSLREFVFTPRTNRSIHRHSIRINLFLRLLPLFCSPIFFLISCIPFLSIPQRRGISAGSLTAHCNICVVDIQRFRLKSFAIHGYASRLLSVEYRLLLTSLA